MRSIGSLLSALALVVLFLTAHLSDARVAAGEQEAAVATTEEADASVDDVLGFAEVGDTAAIRKAVANGFDINQANKTGLTAWHVAKMAGFASVADKLVEELGADNSVPFPAAGQIADAALSENRSNETPALVVLVAKDGEVVWERAYGYANVKDKVAADTNTKFRIGSVTKQFTSAAILKLQEEGKLSVKDTVNKFFPDFPRGDEVTLHHLMQHISGIHSYTSQPDFGERVVGHMDAEALVTEIQGYAYDFDPGDKYMYCNSGYFMLGRVIEIASGQTYADYLQTRFFEPLGMNDTGVYVNGTEYTNESTGYSYVDGQFKDAKPWDMSWAGGAGILYSTTHDMMKWNEGVFGGHVLSEASLKAAFTPATLNDGSTESYGYGWSLAEPRGLKKIAHNGGLDGFASYLARYPEQNVTIVAFSNSVPDGPEFSAYEAGPELASIFLWDAYEPREEMTIDDSIDLKQLEKYCGRYDYGGAIMTVTLEDGQFFAQLAGQPAIKVFPKSETVLFARVVDASIEFVLDENGEVSHVIHRQGGQELQAPRAEDAEFVALTPEQLDKFVGEYSYGPLGTMKVTRNGDKLMAQLTGQPALEIRPVSESAFSWVDVAARIEFDVDDDGVITGATHYQAGQSLPVTVKE